MAGELAEVTRLKYQELARALAQANIGQGIVAESNVWQQINSGNLSAAEFNQLVTSNAGYNAGFRAIGNANGTIRSYTYIGSDYPIGEFTYDDIIGSFNSNVQSGTSSAANTFTMQQPTNTALSGAAGSEKVAASGGVTKYVNGSASANPILTTMGSVTSAVMAAGAGIQLAKTLDSAVYNIGNALGLDPPETLNPETWNSITADSDAPTAGIFNYIFGLNPDNGKITAYTDAEAFAYMAGWMLKQGYFDAGGQGSWTPPEGITITPDFHVSEYIPTPISTFHSPIDSATSETNFLPQYERQILSMTDGCHVASYKFSDGTIRVAVFSSEPNQSYTYRSRYRTTSNPNPAWGEALTKALRSKTIQVNDETYTGYYDTSTLASSKTAYGDLPLQIVASTPSPAASGVYVDSKFLVYLTYITKYGTYHPPTSVEGVGTQPDGTLPDTTNWDYNDPHNTILPSLQTQYPGLWNNRLENDVVQPDGSIKKYVYLPTVIPDGGNGTNPDTQNNKQSTNPEVDPDDSSETTLQTIIQIITSLLPQGMTDPETVPEEELQDGTNTKNPNPDIPNDNPPDTGTGATPTILPPTGSASSLWKVYHPSQAQVDAFGAWLWSSNFVEQIKKMFNDPMQSIIGLHKIFAAPVDGGTATIKVGYLDSGVSSAYVDSQYVTVDCGSVSLSEYFGNVFDYEPHTKVSIFLPFIGIQKLDVSEVMRSTIGVVYHVDVFSGACLAEVSVTRDGGGGCLYTFSGDASARYPISSGSYMGIVSGVLSIAGGIAGTIATGGAALPALMGAGAAATHMHTDVSHSGQISGNAGAMGGKVPYLIVVRPQTEVAKKSERYYGYGANSYCKVESLSGFARLYNAVVRPNDSITDEERKEIQTILESGFYA